MDVFTPQVIQLIAVAAIVAFLADFVGNLISFGSRIGNAVVSALIFAGIFIGANYATMNVTGASFDITQAQYWQPIAISGAVFFVVALVGNLISFGSRFTNAIVTAIVFAVLFAASYWFAVTNGAIPAIG